MWKKISELGNLSADVTPHTLRHSFTSLAADLGYSELTIGALVGHKGRTITSRYVHSADAVWLSAADAVATKTAALLNGKTAQSMSSRSGANLHEFSSRFCTKATQAARP